MNKSPNDDESRPARYNAAADLLERNLVAGRESRIAFIDERGSYTYAEVAERVGRCGNVLRALGIQPEQRLVLCLLDTIDFPTCFLGAILAGIVPIPLNTMLRAADFAAVLADSQPAAAIVSAPQLATFHEAAALAGWSGRIIVSGVADGLPALAVLLDAASAEAQAAATGPDDLCFLLYSSGSTGKPKGVMHRHSSMIQTAELYAQGILGIDQGDTVYSAPKLFFAYGLGNALSFTMSVGATSVLYSGRPTAAGVNNILREHLPTLFFGVPTLFNAMLASGEAPARGEHTLRFCVSAGEALSADLGRAWRERTGVDLVDGIGSTEMLHIFVSNRPGEVRYGVTGRPVPGYRIRIVEPNGQDVRPGEIGEMLVAGPTAAAGYWNDTERSNATFQGDWVRTGDKFRQTPEGDYVHCGRNDDMLKVGGIWVSPLEVEAALMAHEAILEAAVVGACDEAGLMKPKAFVVLKQGTIPGPTLVQAIQDFVKNRLAPYKYPRWIEFMDALPKTATGKIQRYVLRAKEQQYG